MNAVAATSCHHLPRTSSLCASASIVPQDTMSTRDAEAEERQDHLGLDEADHVQRQLHQDTWLTFGRMWPNMRARCEAPIASAGRTYSRAGA